MWHCILLCIHFHSSVQSNHWMGQPWPINLLFSSFARETRPGFLCLLRRWPDVPFLKLFEPLSNTELAVLAWRSAAWFAHSSISLHGCRSHYGRQATNRVQHCVFHVSSGHANVQHVVVDGVDAISRAHVWRIVFCLPPRRQDDVLPCNRTKQHTQQPVGCRLCGCFMRFFSDNESAYVLRAWFAPESNAQVSMIAPGPSVSRTQATDVELVRVVMPRIHNGTVFLKSVCRVNLSIARCFFFFS